MIYATSTLQNIYSPNIYQPKLHRPDLYNHHTWTLQKGCQMDGSLGCHNLLGFFHTTHWKGAGTSIFHLGIPKTGHLDISSSSMPMRSCSCRHLQLWRQRVMELETWGQPQIQRAIREDPKKHHQCMDYVINRAINKSYSYSTSS